MKIHFQDLLVPREELEPLVQEETLALLELLGPPVHVVIQALVLLVLQGPKDLLVNVEKMVLPQLMNVLLIMVVAVSTAETLSKVTSAIAMRAMKLLLLIMSALVSTLEGLDHSRSF